MEASALQAPAALAHRRVSIALPWLRLRSDDQLVALFRAGNDEAFSVIHDRYRQRLFAYTRQMLPGSRQDAEDALQDVFVRAYGGLRANDRELALRAWLYRVAHNRCIDELRRPPMPAPELLECSRPPALDPLAITEQRDTLRRLIADVRRLPEQQRSALLMRELSDMSYAELAHALDVSVPAVKSLLVRARIGLARAADARDAACSEIREELTLAHDRGVRPNSTARRHLRDCAGCREFRSDLRGLRRQLAALTPALGPAGVLAKLVGFGGGAGGGAAGGAAVAGAGGAMTTGGLLAGGASHAVTLLAAAVITAGGAVELQNTLIVPSQHHHAHHAGRVTTNLRGASFRPSSAAAVSSTGAPSDPETPAASSGASGSATAGPTSSGATAPSSSGAPATTKQAGAADANQGPTPAALYDMTVPASAYTARSTATPTGSSTSPTTKGTTGSTSSSSPGATTGASGATSTPGTSSATGRTSTPGSGSTTGTTGATSTGSGATSTSSGGVASPSSGGTSSTGTSSTGSSADDSSTGTGSSSSSATGKSVLVTL